MKISHGWLLPVALLVPLGGGCGPSEPSDEVPPTGVETTTQELAPATMPAPVGYWRFDDCVAGKTTFNDYSSNNYKASIGSGVTCSGSGKVMRAGSFNGASTAQAQVPDKAAINSAIGNAFTVAAWVKPSSLPTTTSRSYAVADKWNNSKNAFKLILTSNGYKFTVTLPPAAGTTTERQFSAQAPATLSTTSWTHVAGTYTRTTGKLTLYVNGAVAATRTATAPLAGMQTSTAPLRIGNAPTAGTTTYGFAGLIDEVWLGSGALDQARIQALMNGPHADTGGACFETPKTSKVLVLVYNPYHPSAHLDQATHGNAITDAVAGSHELVEIHRSTTGGLLNYQIADLRFINGRAPQLEVPQPGNTADYGAIFSQHNLCSRIQNENISEIWLWGDNNSGFDELAYKVPGDAIPNRSMQENGWLYDWRTKNIPDCGKTIVVMGYNYSVGMDNTVHAYNHRMECMLSMTVGKGRFLLNIPDPANPDPQRDPLLDPTNPWSIFSRWNDFNLAPNQAQVGTVHFPPNATSDYDYGNSRVVSTTAEDWLKYPFLTGAKTSMDCSPWNCDALEYQKWYESHIPRAAGTSYGGMCNNWWTYVADYDRRNALCTGTGCKQPIGATCDNDAGCASGTCRCGACVAAGANPTCKAAAFDACTTASQCASGICGCPGETGTTRRCLPDQAYVDTCYQPVGGPCWGDGDCASRTCGCNGGSVVQCLPAGQSRTCSGVPNWQACLQDGDCESGVCGCNGGPRPKVCLPNANYPRTCSN